MKLKNKILILVTLIWILFLFISNIGLRYFLIYIEQVNKNIANDTIVLFSSFSMLFLLLILWLLNILFFYHNEFPLHYKTKSQQILTNYDSITSLPSNIIFNEILNKSINNAKRHDKILAILLINIDSFKKINAQLGYTESNRFIKELGKQFSHMLRGNDFLARVNNDEFIILLNDIQHIKFAGMVANKLLSTADKLIKMENKPFPINVNIGISIFPNDGESLEFLQKNANVAMQKAKYLGGNHYQYHTNEMDLQMREHIKFELELHNAINNQQFVLYYQPQLNLKSGKISRVEALIRWEHPQLGIIGPDTFIPLAEESGLILKIDEWVLNEACRMGKIWQSDNKNITIAVNLSAKQFHTETVIHMIENALKKCELDPQYLEVEITETAVLENVDTALEKLNRIHAMGIRICIDDFGSGYTSINYLRKFPIDTLKISQSFIKDIPHDANDAAITSSVISLGHNLGLAVVAEGVENNEQMNFLAKHHCDLVQGYYISFPLSAESVPMQFDSKPSA